MNLIQERTIALAAIVQACSLVQSLARTGQCIESDEVCLLRSVKVFDATSTAAIFGGVAGVRSGLETLSEGVLVNPSGQALESLMYVNGLLKLQTNLYRDRSRFADFAKKIEGLAAFDDDAFTHGCSEVYQQFISPINPRIIVQGEETHLQTERVPERIRALLLAGIRAAVLWQQKGGSRFRLVWERTRMQNAARGLLQTI